MADNLGFGSYGGLDPYKPLDPYKAAEAAAPVMAAAPASASSASTGAGDPTAANNQLLAGQVNNPYLDAQAQNIQTRLNRNLNENIMPGIGQGAIGAGQYGSSRQGIAQGKAIAETQDNYAGQMANLYGTANENAQNRMASTAANLSGLGAQVSMSNANAATQAAIANQAQSNNVNLQNQSQQNNYNLQNQNLMNSFNLNNQAQGLQNQSQMQNFYTQNRQLDQSGIALGANLYGIGNTGNTAADTSQTALGASYQNAPLTALQNYSNTLSPYTGLGGTQSSTQNGVQSTGGGAIGTVGGALAGSQIYNNLGFGNNANATNQLVNVGGYTNTPAYMVQPQL